MKSVRIAAVIGGALSCLCALGRADNVDDIVKMMAASTKDQVELAGRFLSGAAEATADANLRRRLYEEAYRTGLKCKGVEGPIISIRAARAVAKQGPDERVLWQDRLAAAYVRRQQVSKREQTYQAGAELVDVMIDVADERLSAARYEDALRFLRDASSVSTAVKYRSDEVQARLGQAIARRRYAARAAELKKKFGENGAGARSDLIRLLIVELDRPGEAAKLLNAGCSEVLRTYVPMVAKPVGKLPKEACMELGDWYRTLARGASPAGRLQCMRRAKACYERFLSLHSAGDAASLKARAMLGNVNGELKGLGGNGGTGQYLGTYRDEKKNLWVLTREKGVRRLLLPGHHMASASCQIALERLRFRFAPYLKGPGFRRAAVVEFSLADVGRYEAKVGPDPDAKRPSRAVGLSPIPKTTHRLTRVAEDPFAVFVSRDTAGGVFVHRFYDNGHIVLPTINCIWKLRGRRIMLRWAPDRRAPGGAWVDTGTVGAEGRSYNAVNQGGCRNKAVAILGRLPVR